MRKSGVRIRIETEGIAGVEEKREIGEEIPIRYEIAQDITISKAHPLWEKSYKKKKRFS
ncbi:hypothetical protein J7J18_02120 [bacterium]|nr:hypothetical protein [bacterium]